MCEEKSCANCGLLLKRSKKVIVLSYWKAKCLDRKIEKYFCNECRSGLIEMPCKSEDLIWQKIRSSTGKKFLY